MYVHGKPADPLTVVAVKDRRVLTQTGEHLSLLVHDVLQASRLAWPLWAQGRVTQPQPMMAAWVLPDHQLFRFECPCAAHWGPHDVEAECQLEASARLQIPPDQLAIHYQVHRALEGLLSATVEGCQQGLVGGCMAQLKAVGLQLQVFTTRSQTAGLASFLGLAHAAQQALHRSLDAPFFPSMAEGETTC